MITMYGIIVHHSSSELNRTLQPTVEKSLSTDEIIHKSCFTTTPSLPRSVVSSRSRLYNFFFFYSCLPPALQQRAYPICLVHAKPAPQPIRKAYMKQNSQFKIYGANKYDCSSPGRLLEVLLTSPRPCDNRNTKEQRSRNCKEHELRRSSAPTKNRMMHSKSKTKSES